jgi:N-formylglutamate deformylase
MIEGDWPLPVTTDQVVLQKVRLGKGLIWKFTDEGVPIYDRQLPAAELLQRIERCWKPYHAAVERAIDAAHVRHGYSIHINCHSMPSVAASHATLHPGLVHADFVIGDRDGSTSSPALSERICAFLRERGYSRYGKPAEHRHSIQIEINRKLYMNEQTLDLDQAGYLRLTTDLKALVEQLMATDPRTL